MIDWAKLVQSEQTLINDGLPSDEVSFRGPPVSARRVQARRDAMELHRHVFSVHTWSLPFRRLHLTVVLSYFQSRTLVV
jgi:hypothetical protein